MKSGREVKASGEGQTVGDLRGKPATAPALAAKSG